MATRAQVNDRFAAVMGINPMTVERQNRALADAGLIRKGKPGGRSGSSHYNATELANLILAQAAGMPSEAPEVVRILGDLRG